MVVLVSICGYIETDSVVFSQCFALVSNDNNRQLNLLESFWCSCSVQTQRIIKNSHQNVCIGVRLNIRVFFFSSFARPGEFDFVVDNSIEHGNQDHCLV